MVTSKSGLSFLTQTWFLLNKSALRECNIVSMNLSWMADSDFAKLVPFEAMSNSFPVQLYMEKNATHDALKSFYFRKKGRCAKRNFAFIFWNCHGNAFYERISVGNLSRIAISLIFRDENIVYIAFKFVVNKTESGWLKTSHSAQLHF